MPEIKINANEENDLDFNGEEDESEEKFYGRKEDLGAGMMRGNLSSTLKEV